MPPYSRDEARGWTREHMRGVFNVIIPSFSADLRTVNEAGIRHDVRRDIELGFSGALMVSETATTIDEYLDCVEWAADEAKGRLHIVCHASFNTFEENVEATRRAGERGADLVLMGYPPGFYPTNVQDVMDHTAAFGRQSALGVILFPKSGWGFDRLHGACLPIDAVSELVDAEPNIVAVKAEGGGPIVGFAHAWHKLEPRVIVTMPIIQQAIALSALVPLQVIATSNSEYFGTAVPQMLDLAVNGKVDDAFEILWRVAPAFRANGSVGKLEKGHLVNRAAWKYQAWLNGFNGGPLRMPTPRLHPEQMSSYRKALVASDIPVTADDDAAFYVGRT